MARRDIVVVGASAGGVEALQRLLSPLPSGFSAAVFMTLHVPERSTSVLPRILSRVSQLPVSHAVEGEPITAGHVYVASPGFHLLITRRGICLGRGPKENGNRPAIDPMFRSAALEYGPRVVGVVLTGNLDDGTAGLRAIKRAGGVAVAQDPADAMFASMPRSAIQHVSVDHVAPLRDIAQILMDLTSQEIRDDELSPGDSVNVPRRARRAPRSSGRR